MITQGSLQFQLFCNKCGFCISSIFNTLLRIQYLPFFSWYCGIVHLPLSPSFFSILFFLSQDLLKIHLDCDSDTLKFVVRQQGQGFCHLNTWTCFGPRSGLLSLMSTLRSRKQSAPPGSYTERLYKDSKLLHTKIREEAEELCEAESKEEITWEAADVLYFTLVKCAKAGKIIVQILAVCRMFVT